MSKFLSVLGLFLFSTAHAETPADYEYDCGLLQGIVIAHQNLNAFKTFEFYDAKGMAGLINLNNSKIYSLEKGVEWASKSAKTHGTELSLMQHKISLEAAIVRSRQGDVHSLQAILRGQLEQIELLAYQAAMLRNEICKNTERKW